MPENRGNAVAHTGGRTHVPLPRVDEPGYRTPHQQRDPKPTSTFDWDWNKAECTGCETKVAKSTLVDGICRTCRGEPELPVPARREAYSPYDEDDLEEIFTPGHALPDVPDDPDLPDSEPTDEELLDEDEPAVVPVTKVAAPDHRSPELRASDDADAELLEPALASATAGLVERLTQIQAEHEAAEAAEQRSRVARELRAPSRRPVADAGLLEEAIQHADRTFRAAHGIEDPIVGILRTAALSAIAALDFYVALHCRTDHTDSRGTAGTPLDGAASQTDPAPSPGLGGDQPAARPRGEARPRPAGFQAFERPKRRLGVRRPRVELDESAVLLEYAAGDTAPAIARRHGVLPKRIRQILVDHRVQLRDDRGGHSGGRNRRVWDQATIDDVVRRYVDQKQSCGAIQDATGIERRQVARILTEAGVTMRPSASEGHVVLSDEQRAEAVELYLSGENLAAVGQVFGVRQQAIHDIVVAAGHPIRVKGASAAIAERMRELGITAAQVKEWAVESGLVEARPAGLPGRALIDAYVAAHQQEGPAA